MPEKNVGNGCCPLFWRNCISSPKNVEICGSMRKIRKFHLISWWGNIVERHSFRRVSGESHETLRKLCLSAKFPHQEIRWNFSILCSGSYKRYIRPWDKQLKASIGREPLKWRTSMEVLNIFNKTIHYMQ